MVTLRTLPRQPVDRSGERGEGRLGFFVSVVAVACLGFVGFKVIPVRIQAYQFRDTLREEARFASVNRQTDGEIKERIMEEAQALNIPLEADNLKIERSRKEVVISAHYIQPIDLKLTTYTYRFREEQRSPVF